MTMVTEYDWESDTWQGHLVFGRVVDKAQQQSDKAF
jgi:hypothetical protein